MSTSLTLSLILLALPADPVVRADMLFTASLAAILLVLGAIAIRLLPWHDSEMLQLEAGLRAGASRLRELLPARVVEVAPQAMTWVSRG